VIAPVSIAWQTIAQRRREWLVLTLGITVLYYVGLVVSVVVRLGHPPNYFTLYDWPGNVLTIIRATPSVRDMAPLILDEWLVEFGYMNYHYGRGVAEWTLEIIPSRVAMTMLLGAMVATVVLLLRRARGVCPRPERGAGIATAGIGAALVGVTNVTMSWVACCSAPSWVAGLSLIGIETSAAFALLPYGDAMTWGGYAALLVTAYWLAWRCVVRPGRGLVLPPARLATQDR
jgi:hypothetical protein